LQKFSPTKLPEQKRLWKKTIIQISNIISGELKKANNSLNKNTTIKDSTHFNNLLKPLKQSVGEALSERKKILEFLDQYHKINHD
jgi:hypothetical protein